MRVKQAARNATKKGLMKKKTANKIKDHHHASSLSSASPTPYSKLVGVTWCKQTKKWKAQIAITINGRKENKCLGRFDDEKEAACKYDEQAALLNRPVNFPQHEGQEQAVKKRKDRSKLPHVTRKSKFVGVSWYKTGRKWKSEIGINGERKYLGIFDNEKDAACKYDEQAALFNKPVNFPQHEGQEQKVKFARHRKGLSKLRSATKQSKFVGVNWHKHAKKWLARIMIDGTIQNLGSFDDEKEAACKYDEQAALFNKPVNFPQHEGQTQAVKAVKRASPVESTSDVEEEEEEEEEVEDYDNSEAILRELAALVFEEQQSHVRSVRL
jgi:hypothetical protein